MLWLVLLTRSLGSARPLGDLLPISEPFHAAHQRRLGCLYHQMKMVSHQNEGVDLPSSFLCCLFQSLKESSPVVIIQKDYLSPVSPAHHMVDSTFVFDPKLACHSYFLSGKGFSLQEKSLNTRD